MKRMIIISAIIYQTFTIEAATEEEYKAKRDEIEDTALALQGWTIMSHQTQTFPEGVTE